MNKTKIKLMNEIREEFQRLDWEFKNYQKKYEKSTEEYNFYEGSLNGVSSCDDIIVNMIEEEEQK